MRRTHSDWARIGHPRNRVLLPGRGKKFISSPNYLDRLWAHPACHSTAIGMSFPGLKLSDCEVDRYHLILRLRMSVAVPPVPYIPP